jgi:hypothetical protein
LITGLWGAVPTPGSHPGLSDEQEERFRLITVTDCCRFLLARLDTLGRDQRSRPRSFLGATRERWVVAAVTRALQAPAGC